MAYGMCISLFILKYLCNPLLYISSIFSYLICFKVPTTLDVQLGLDKLMKSILETDEDLNYFDKVMQLLTKNRIFEITSMSWMFDSVMLATQIDLKTKGIIHFRTTLTWIIAQVVTPVLLQLHMLFVIQGTTPLFCSKSLSYQGCKKNDLVLEKKPLILSILRLNLPFKI